jgi:hypothetical protein
MINGGASWRTFGRSELALLRFWTRVISPTLKDLDESVVERIMEIGWFRRSSPCNRDRLVHKTSRLVDRKRRTCKRALG